MGNVQIEASTCQVGTATNNEIERAWGQYSFPLRVHFFLSFPPSPPQKLFLSTSLVENHVWGEKWKAFLFSTAKRL